VELEGCKGQLEVESEQCSTSTEVLDEQSLTEEVLSWTTAQAGGLKHCTPPFYPFMKCNKDTEVSVLKV
jgi:hypothetical protein